MKAIKNLVKTEVQEGNRCVTLVLHWQEAGTHLRCIQAETFRIAGIVCEKSKDEY